VQAHTQNWKPAWRAVYHTACVLWASLTALVLLFQIGWLDGVYRYPHGLLEQSTGDSHWSAVTTGFHDGAHYGGSRVWNLRIPEEQAALLREKCSGPARMKSIEAMRLPGVVILMSQKADSTQVWLPGRVEELAHQRLEWENRQPTGCWLGLSSERASDRHAGTAVGLFGRVIQIQEWVH